MGRGGILHEALKASQLAQWCRISLPMQETQEAGVPSTGWEDPLEEEIATCSGILAGVIPWTEEPGRLQWMGSQKDGVAKSTHARAHS